VKPQRPRGRTAHHLEPSDLGLFWQLGHANAMLLQARSFAVFSLVYAQVIENNGTFRIASCQKRRPWDLTKEFDRDAYRLHESGIVGPASCEAVQPGRRLTSKFEVVARSASGQ
jgi:hypothetical protein